MSALLPKKAALKDLKILDDELLEFDPDNESYLDWFKIFMYWIFQHSITIERILKLYHSEMNYDQWADTFVSLSLPCNRLGVHVGCRWLENTHLVDCEEMRITIWMKILDRLDCSDMITEETDGGTQIILIKTHSTFAYVTFKLKLNYCTTSLLDFEVLVNVESRILDLKYIIREKLKLFNVKYIHIYTGRGSDPESMLRNNETLFTIGVFGGPEVLPNEVTLFYDFVIRAPCSLLIHKITKELHPIHNRKISKIAQYKRKT